MKTVMPRAGLMKRVSMLVPPMHAMRHRILAATVLLALAVAAPRFGATSSAASPDGVARAVFTTSGEATLPLGYRQWEHVGTRDNAAGKLSILDGMPTTTPEVLNTYVEPHALAAYRKAGVWPDGTQLVKEFSAVRIGPACNGGSFLCTTDIGEGVFQAGYIGLGMMIKDAKRFPDAPGHWGFFSFGHRAPPYESVSAVRPADRCSYCHVNLASDTDYVFSRAHIGLARQ
jgi:Cytochrome P460